MSKTPETDQNFVCDSAGNEWVHVSFARKLEMQRDELLEALEAMVAANPGVAVMPTMEAKIQNAANDKARAVIAKVKQESK